MSNLVNRMEELAKKLGNIERQTKTVIALGVSDAKVIAAIEGSAHDAQLSVMREYINPSLLMEREKEIARLDALANSLRGRVKELSEMITELKAKMPALLEAEDVYEKMREMGVEDALLVSFEAQIMALRKTGQSTFNSLIMTETEWMDKAQELNNVEVELERLEWPVANHLSGDEIMSLISVVPVRVDISEDYTQGVNENTSQAAQKARRNRGKSRPQALNPSCAIIDMLLEHYRSGNTRGMSGQELNAAYVDNEPSLRERDHRAESVMYHIVRYRNKKASEYLSEQDPNVVILPGKRKSLRNERTYHTNVYRIVDRAELTAGNVPLILDLNDCEDECEAWEAKKVFDPEMFPTDVAATQDATVSHDAAVSPVEIFPFLEKVSQLDQLWYQEGRVAVRCFDQIVNDARTVLEALADKGLDLDVEPWPVGDIATKLDIELECMRDMLITAFEKQVIATTFIDTMSFESLIVYEKKINIWVRIFLAQRYDLCLEDAWQDVGKGVGRALRDKRGW